ncbi:hypothetical protein CTA2_11444 [Colletotrichum tanaceti]|uniref:Uncharacterized protein n=1 Tax=Colletotrichum tanaceti TaxID=1306861 RepID=A0A4U6XSS7_9PEZI|nr:hypothetical protein CTA2_11444 [Colletotrichum tanaceti]TKW58993.1 hypothetical protein CTA1_1628 [Colletotrichum tanaceti]
MNQQQTHLESPHSRLVSDHHGNLALVLESPALSEVPSPSTLGDSYTRPCPPRSFPPSCVAQSTFRRPLLSLETIRSNPQTLVLNQIHVSGRHMTRHASSFRPRIQNILILRQADHHQQANHSMLTMKPPSILAPLLLPVAFAAPSPAWECTATSPPGPGLGHASLLAIHSTFTRLYGPDPLTLGPEQARVAICGGLLFGLWNGHPHAVTEKAGRRETLVFWDPRPEGTQCLGHADDADAALDDDLRLTYMFGVGEDSWISGGLTEVRRCEDEG